MKYCVPVPYSRNNENLIVGRHKRNAVNDKEFEHFQIVYGQDMADLLKLSEEVDELEKDLMAVKSHRRTKRESVDHIGNVIMVCSMFIHTVRVIDLCDGVR